MESVIRTQSVNVTTFTTLTTILYKVISIERTMTDKTHRISTKSARNLV